MTDGAGDTMKLSAGAADRVTAFHRRAYTLLDGLGDRPASGAAALGDGANHIDAVLTQLVEGVQSIAQRHSLLGYSAQINAHGVNSLDERVRDAFSGTQGR